MTDVLIVTLGTSPEPIINCITSLRPDRVVFLCSLESQKLIDAVRSEVPLHDFEQDRDVVVLQQRLGNKQSAAVSNELDQLDRVYFRALDLFDRVRSEARGCRLIADYTGGTKTMTTGLAMAAIDDGDVRLHLTVSDRSRGQASLSGYSSPVAVSTAAIHARRLRERELPALLKRHDYEAARQAVRRVQSLVDQDAETTQWLQWLEALLVGLDAWDRFDHQRAIQVLEGLNDRRLDQLLLFPLKRVIGSRRLLDKDAEEQRWPQMKGHGLEAVEDLRRNAERRAAQERYDDAVGRLYRAMELCAQILMRIGLCESVGEQGLLTDDLAIERLPAELQRQFEDRKKPVQIGLKDTWDLLDKLAHPAGLEWRKQRSAILDQLKIRNNSLFAHGFQPISYASWRKMSSVIIPFLDTVIDGAVCSSNSARLPQLPSSLAELCSHTDCWSSLPCGMHASTQEASRRGLLTDAGSA